MARGVDAAADLLVNGVHGVGRCGVKQGDRLLAAVGKFLLMIKPAVTLLRW